MTDENVQQTELTDFGWCILELMGHRTRVGQVAEHLVAGALMLRVDIPAGETHISEYYSPGSVYSMQPISEEIARREMERNDPRPMRPVDYRDPPALPDHATEDDAEAEETDEDAQ